jgi:hypothetical protein
MRAACIVVTAFALSCLGIVMVGQLSSDNKAPLTSLGRDLYFLKVRQQSLSPLKQVNIYYRQTQVTSQLTCILYLTRSRQLGIGLTSIRILLAF